MGEDTVDEQKKNGDVVQIHKTEIQGAHRRVVLIRVRLDTSNMITDAVKDAYMSTSPP